jgi:hypothetical protein
MTLVQDILKLFGIDPRYGSKYGKIVPKEKEYFGDLNYVKSDNSKFIGLIHSDSPLRNYQTNGYSTSFIIDGYVIHLCDQDDRYVGEMYRTPKNKQECKEIEDITFWRCDEKSKELRDKYNYFDICLEDDYCCIKHLINSKEKTHNEVIDNVFDEMVINGVKYDWRACEIFGKYRAPTIKEQKLYDRINEFLTAHMDIATTSSGGISLTKFKNNYMVYIWKPADTDILELNILPEGASQYDTERRLYHIQLNRSRTSDCILQDGTPLYQDMSLALELLNE